MQSSGVVVGWLSVRTRSDSSAANRSLAHFAERAKAGQSLSGLETDGRRAESQAAGVRAVAETGWLPSTVMLPSGLMVTR
jgi:hypothetical protein